MSCASSAELPAVILAGGRSRRMGRDKALLTFGNCDSLAQYQYRKLKKCFSTVHIATKEASKFKFEASFIVDNSSEYAPAVALETVMGEVAEPYFFVIAVDMPFVQSGALQTVLKAPYKEYDAVVASSGGMIHPLLGIYATKLRPTFAKAVKEGRHKLQSLLAELNTLYLSIDDAKSFINLNHPADYKTALAALDKKPL